MNNTNDEDAEFMFGYPIQEAQNIQDLKFGQEENNSYDSASDLIK